MERLRKVQARVSRAIDICRNRVLETRCCHRLKGFLKIRFTIVLCSLPVATQHFLRDHVWIMHRYLDAGLQDTSMWTFDRHGVGYRLKWGMTSLPMVVIVCNACSRSSRAQRNNTPVTPADSISSRYAMHSAGPPMTNDFSSSTAPNPR